MYRLTGALGIFLMVTPFFFSFIDNPAALWTAIITGGLVAFVSYMEAIRHDRDNWEYWVAEILGIFAVAAPFILGFHTHAVATGISMVFGTLIALMAASRIWMGRPLKGW